jgi:hypothetical protein
MHRLFALCLVAAPAALTACVTEDPPPLFVDVDYQVRCVSCSPRTADDAPHAVAALDGEDSFRVGCSAQHPGKDRLLTFSATYIDMKHPSNEYSIKVLQLDLDKTDPGAGCRVVVGEGENTYEGKCTSDTPTDDAPCQVKLKVKDGIVKGSLLCANIPNSSEASLTRHIVKPGTEQAAPVEVRGCVGL